MLSKEQPIVALNPERKQNFSESLLEVLGEKPGGKDPLMERMTRRSIALSEANAVKYGRPNKFFMLLVDHSEIAKVKSQVCVQFSWLCSIIHRSTIPGNRL